MKHTIEGIEKILSEVKLVKPFPWKYREGYETGIEILANENAQGQRIANMCHSSFGVTEHDKVLAKFITTSPEIISDLVEEVKFYQGLLFGGELTKEDFFKEQMRIREEENQRLREALNEIASWSEGPEVSGFFDEPGSAEIARKALEGI